MYPRGLGVVALLPDVVWQDEAGNVIDPGIIDNTGKTVMTDPGDEAFDGMGPLPDQTIYYASSPPQQLPDLVATAKSPILLILLAVLGWAALSHARGDRSWGDD